MTKFSVILNALRHPEQDTSLEAHSVIRNQMPHYQLTHVIVSTTQFTGMIILKFIIKYLCNLWRKFTYSITIRENII